MLRSFLWFGVGDAKRAGKVAWEKVCYPKEEGGLAIKNMRTWNKAAILQLGWEIVTKKESIWVRWCNLVLLKDKRFWAVKITSASSWCWSNVLRLRECLARNLIYSIGDGRATALWWDPWVNGEALFTKYGTRVAIDADIPIRANVSAVIANRKWAWPRNSWDLREIDTLVQRICIEEGPDVIHWRSKGKTFSCKAPWQGLRHILPKVAWADIVWFPDCIPKRSFCL
ncbi:hypothetical protein CFOL_v3_11147 [Cephalotus follicularis]|uniref:Zf-RVT domain-containing protein n=1 Tax=Cephalotus follicularis TaxID=3775 RepID=A0A1Q3BIG6_CEPFO|nr:hypothetical protein CFOL_v3_11147 [Cephalotus follicularis]